MNSRSIFNLSTRALICLNCMVILVISEGCKQSEPPPGPPKLVPVTGKITHEGKPLAGAIVQFNPTGPIGNLLSIGETDENGKYELSHMNFPGCAPGGYKVAVSLTLTTQGKPVTIAQQSALSPSPATIGAKEVIPAKYSSLGQTTMTATVPEQGGTFDFDLTGPLLDPPAPEPASNSAAGEPAKPAAESKMP
jgi:hypothetical protein